MTNVEVRVREDGGWVTVDVRDDGVGGAHVDAGPGLHGLADRVSALGGRLEVVSPPGEGTAVTAWIAPVAPIGEARDQLPA